MKIQIEIDTEKLEKNKDYAIHLMDDVKTFMNLSKKLVIKLMRELEKKYNFSFYEYGEEYSIERVLSMAKEDLANIIKEEKEEVKK